MTTSVQPLVSVITPVYNEERHLAECIESVLSQTYSNWDYTIVDNGSTDGTFEIAQRYAVKDSRIRVHRNDRTVAVIPNHNIALRQISPQSKYCKVVFGDDWIFPNCLEQMVELAEAHPSVAIVGAYALEGERIAWAGLPYPSHIVSGREICRRHLLEGLYVFGSANAVLYRADLIRNRNPFFNESNIHADTEVCFALLKACDFGFVHQILTFTRVRPVSLSAATADLETSYACILRLLVTCARDYLTAEEYDARIARHASEYYRFLGKNLFLARDKKFWDYHKRELVNSGVGFSRSRVVQGALQTIWSTAARPGDIAQKVLRNRHRLRLPVRLEVPVPSQPGNHKDENSIRA